MQMEVLRQQVNPHFLFNTLNTLKILIKADPEKAEAFTVQLANVYRYLLQHHRRSIVHLSQELEFIQSYLSLLKIRFGEALIINIDVPPKCHKYKLLSLSLQILMENAVKHNAVTRQAPLRLKIFINELGQLVVENDLQVRANKERSGQFGLYHLNEQYKRHTYKEIGINRDNNRFSVVLPLIKDTNYECFDY